MSHAVVVAPPRLVVAVVAAILLDLAAGSRFHFGIIITHIIRRRSRSYSLPVAPLPA